MTKHECAVIMAYTGICMLKGDDLKFFYEYIAELMKRPVYTHEIGGSSEDIKEKAKPDFIRLCNEAAESVRHGRWIESGINGTVHCSNCRFTDFFAKRDRVMLFGYCPGCGAKMDKQDGGVEDGTG